MEEELLSVVFRDISILFLQKDKTSPHLDIYCNVVTNLMAIWTSLKNLGTSLEPISTLKADCSKDVIKDFLKNPCN